MRLPSAIPEHATANAPGNMHTPSLFLPTYKVFANPKPVENLLNTFYATNVHGTEVIRKIGKDELTVTTFMDLEVGCQRLEGLLEVCDHEPHVPETLQAHVHNGVVLNWRQRACRIHRCATHFQPPER